MDPWLNALIIHVMNTLGEGWESLPTKRKNGANCGSYFFKATWSQQFDGWGHMFPPYHFFINNYTDKKQNLYCIIRFEAQEIIEKREAGTLTIQQLAFIHNSVFQFFFQNGFLKQAQRDENIFHNPHCLDVNETKLTLPNNFWKAPPPILPVNVLNDIDTFLNSPVTTIFRELN